MKKLLLSLILVFSLVSPLWAGVKFDGVDDYIVGSSVPLNNPTSFTIAGWVNLPTGTIRALYSELPNPNPNLHVFYMALNASDIIVFDAYTPSGGAFIGTSSISANTWTHVAYTQNATTRTSFIDGAQDKTDSLPETYNGDALAEFRIGSYANQPLTGITSDFAVWNTDLSLAEIALLAKSKVKGMPLQIQPANLKGYWPLDDQPDGTSFDGDTAVDRSGNGNDGTGVDGANNTGLTAKAEEVLSYQ